MPNCPRCDTVLSGAEKACPNCKRPLNSPSLASAPVPKKNCPVCKLPIYEAVFADQPVLHCAECKGLAASRDALMKLQPHGAKTLNIGREEREYKRPQYFEPRKKPPFLICPLCMKKMKEIKFGQLTVDLCDECSALWLEASKVEMINDLVGPYKWKMANSGKKPQSRLSRMKEDE